MVCEGQNTEKQYIEGYEKHVGNAAVEVKLARETGDPRKVVEIAKALREVAEDGDYDEVWCVFDRDEHPRFDQAVDMARGNGFELAVSNPCFELWLILHFRQSPGARHRHDLQAMMKTFVPGYDKTIRLSDFVDGILEAEKRSAALDQAAESMDESGRNPTTQMYRLTQSIRRDPDA